VSVSEGVVNPQHTALLGTGVGRIVVEHLFATHPPPIIWAPGWHMERALVEHLMGAVALSSASRPTLLPRHGPFLFASWLLSWPVEAHDPGGGIGRLVRCR
jgi:hypothetical protein